MPANETVLSEDIQFKGKLYIQEALMINGSFRGYIQTTDKLMIEREARVEADIDAVELRVAGFLQGNVFASKKIALEKTAQLVGDLRTADLQVASGAVIRGTCVMD